MDVKEEQVWSFIVHVNLFKLLLTTRVGSSLLRLPLSLLMQSDANSNCLCSTSAQPPSRPPASLHMLFWVPPWGSCVSALSERQWIYVQQLNCEHVRRLRARLPVSTAVKCAGKSIVMSLNLKDITVMTSECCFLLFFFFKTLAEKLHENSTLATAELSWEICFLVSVKLWHIILWMNGDCEKYWLSDAKLVGVAVLHRTQSWEWS